MYYTLQAPISLNSVIKLPSSKSISNRVLIINKLAGNKISLQNLSNCDDTLIMQQALKETSELTDIRAAGTAMRFLTAYYASTPNKTILTGTDRMKHRPIKILVDALRQLGANIKYQSEDGFPPLHIEGTHLQGGEITLSGNVSSQYISALMMVAPTMDKGLKINIMGSIISRTYIALTANLMKIFGIKVHIENERTIEIPQANYSGSIFTIENDWTAASYWYEILALIQDIDAHIELPNLFEKSLQGDSNVAALFLPLGVKTHFNANGVVLSKTALRKTLYEADLKDQPDLAQTLVITCAMLHIPFNITGLQTLRIKETDRLKALCTELAKLGIKIKEKHGDTLVWDGKILTSEKKILIDTYEDHRMAMAFAPCIIKFPNISINNPEVVSKSYPHFWKDLQHAGFKITNL